MPIDWQCCVNCCETASAWAIGTNISKQIHPINPRSNRCMPSNFARSVPTNSALWSSWQLNPYGIGERTPQHGDFELVARDSQVAICAQPHQHIFNTNFRK